MLVCSCLSLIQLPYVTNGSRYWTETSARLAKNIHQCGIEFVLKGTELINNISNQIKPTLQPQDNFQWVQIYSLGPPECKTKCMVPSQPVIDDSLMGVNLQNQSYLGRYLI